MLLDTAIQGNAAMAAEQEKAIATVSSQFFSSFQDVGTLVKDNTHGLEHIKQVMVGAFRLTKLF